MPHEFSLWGGLIEGGAGPEYELTSLAPEPPRLAEPRGELLPNGAALHVPHRSRNGSSRRPLGRLGAAAFGTLLTGSVGKAMI